MKLSYHSIIVENYPDAGQHLIYNTRTQGMVKLDQQLRDVIESYDSQPFQVKERYRQEVDTLHQMGFLSQNEQEETERLKQFLDQLKFSADQVFAVTILTTYACNFKCTYCFEESSRTNVKMDFETCDHVLNWLKHKMETAGYQKLHITFYGGEPLLNKPALEYIASHMNNWCESRGLIFQFMLQTNGYLMTPEIVDSYLKLGLKSVRISVDGVDHDHDRFRPLRGGGKTFQTVVKNILASVDKVPIGISTSYDKGETDHIEKLLNYFENAGVLRKLGRFIFSPVHATLGPKDNPTMIQNSCCMSNYENEALVKANQKIHAMMNARGLAMKSGMSISICPVTRDQAGVTIDQHGRIYKCNSMLGHPELSTGSVRDVEYNDRHREFINLDVWKQCPQDCTYLPMCSGGCRLGSFLKNKNFKVASCHKPYLNAMAPDLIKKEYEKSLVKV